ncbi:hypothetical protein PVAG01_06354 [Phlyctema vagabunda]|uniref:Uncharacterized protein n=1 Tax=Phlyctema vagabunda TaxID=108571 RepID=A0ABR4PFY7_9HELO
MEHVSGVQLHERWHTMDSHQRMLCVKSLGMMSKDMANLSFPAYGSIYFADFSAIRDTKIDIGDNFCIGPDCGTIYSNSAVGEAETYGQWNVNKGPFFRNIAMGSWMQDAAGYRIFKLTLHTVELPMTTKDYWQQSDRSKSSSPKNGKNLLSPKELEEHQKQYKDFETAQKLKLWLVESLNTNSDGWVPNEAWGLAKEANKAAFEKWLESAATSGELDEKEARALWPFHEM